MLLALLAERHPTAHTKVMQSLTSAAAVGRALPVEWLPVEMDVEVVELVARQLSPSQMGALVAERQRQEMGSALFKTFVATAIKLFGGSPATVIRHLGRGWGQIFSNCGEIEVMSQDKGEAVLRIHKLPAVCLDSSEWVGALPYGMQVLFELVKTPGKITATRRGEDVELHFSW